MTGTDAVLFASRYSIGEELGKGGMAVVHAATDVTSGRKVALKQLRARDGATGALAISLFEQEFHVLSEVAHPHVVGVLDYGVSGSTPYYAMELLDGGDLSQRSPMPAPEVCRVFRDVCSALALLHSRRLVYRDLNPHNVRCTRSGVAKLIDFGAMVPMGPARKLIGTLGYIAPEFLHAQSVDGRADLYAVGACMYFALTGRSPHRAQSFAELAVLVLTPPPRPSQLGIEMPPALDELVMELMHPDPAFRPASASEVIDRLVSIGDLPEDSRLPVAGAYLVTPPLIGREAELKRVRKRVARAQVGQGSGMLFEAPAGAGRTRMLEAAVMEAKLAGVLTARADASDAEAGDYGVVDALAAQLIELHPSAAALSAPHAPILGHVLKSVRRAHPTVALRDFADARARRPAVQAALRTWLSALAGAHPIALAVDDAHRIDEPSLAALVLVGSECRQLPLLLLLSAERGAECANAGTFATLRTHAKPRGLANLSHDDTEQLLAATFGESAKLALLADRVFSICHGNPRDVMQLAQFVVNQGIVRYEGGRWLLPRKIDASVLPRSAEEAGTRVLADLSDMARLLARAFALSALPALTFDDCLDLCDGEDRATVLRALGELGAAEIVGTADARYTLTRPMWADAALAQVNPPALRALHARIADMMERRNHPPLLRIHHLKNAEATAAAVAAMVAFCRDSIRQTDGNPDAYHALVESLPRGWYALFDWSIRAAETQGLPIADICAMRQRLAGVLGFGPVASSEHVAILLDQLKRDVGLDLYEALGQDEADAGTRVQQAFAAAQARFDATAEQARWLPPGVAIRTLVQTEIAAAGMVVPSLDYELLSSIPDLRPIEGISPAIATARRLIDGLRHRMAGRLERTEAVYGELLERISGPDNGGIDPTHAAYTRFGVLRGLGMLEAGIGHDRALERADFPAASPPLAVNARLIRMLYSYFDARPHAGDELKRELVLERIGTSAAEWHEGSHLLAEVVAHAAAQDAPRLRETLRDLEVHAGRHRGWQPVMRYAEAELLRLKGKHGEAERLLERELAQTRAGEHQLWCNLAGAHVAALVGASQSERAVACGERYLAAAQATEQGINSVFVLLALSSARLAGGDRDGAQTDVQRALGLLHGRGVRGLLLGCASEVAAQIALARGETDIARTYTLDTEAHLRASDNRVGRARCDRLRRAIGEATGEEMPDAASELDRLLSQIRSEILREHRGSPSVEAWRAALLARVVDEAQAEGAALFLRTEMDSEPQVALALDAEARLASMQALAATCYTRHDTMLHANDDVMEDDDVTRTGADVGATVVDDLEALALAPSDGGPSSLRSVLVLAGARQAARWSLLEAVGRLLAAPPQ